MSHAADSLRIISHRACLNGPDKCRENSLPALHHARCLGYDVEFDVNLDAAQGRLVLTHDPDFWTPEHDARTWLTCSQPDALHALNIKNLYAIPALCALLLGAGTQGQFFLFDFELLADDKAACRFMMRSLSEAGFTVAYRISEREPFFDSYLRTEHVQSVWMDEFSEPWVTASHVRALRDAGKNVFYVSPDLHGCRDLSALRQRWEPLIEAGLSGICTDYPIALAQFAKDLRKENARND